MIHPERTAARNVVRLIAGSTLALTLLPEPPLRAQPAAPTPAATPAPAAANSVGSGDSQENLTVMGRRKHFETAPMPGSELGPPPDKPAPHLGRYKISGDQSQKDGYDAQTGAYIAPFGTAYTGAGPVAGGLASRFGH